MLIDIKTISQSTGAWQAIEIESQPEDFDLSSLVIIWSGRFVSRQAAEYGRRCFGSGRTGCTHLRR